MMVYRDPNSYCLGTKVDGYPCRLNKERYTGRFQTLQSYLALEGLRGRFTPDHSLSRKEILLLEFCHYHKEQWALLNELIKQVNTQSSKQKLDAIYRKSSLPSSDAKAIRLVKEHVLFTFADVRYGQERINMLSDGRDMTGLDATMIKDHSRSSAKARRSARSEDEYNSDQGQDSASCTDENREEAKGGNRTQKAQHFTRGSSTIRTSANLIPARSSNHDRSTSKENARIAILEGRSAIPSSTYSANENSEAEPPVDPKSNDITRQSQPNAAKQRQVQQETNNSNATFSEVKIASMLAELVEKEFRKYGISPELAAPKLRTEHPHFQDEDIEKKSKADSVFQSLYRYDKELHQWDEDLRAFDDAYSRQFEFLDKRQSQQSNDKKESEGRLIGFSSQPLIPPQSHTTKDEKLQKKGRQRHLRHVAKSPSPIHPETSLSGQPRLQQQYSSYPAALEEFNSEKKQISQDDKEAASSVAANDHGAIDPAYSFKGKGEAGAGIQLGNKGSIRDV